MTFTAVGEFRLLYILKVTLFKAFREGQFVRGDETTNTRSAAVLKPLTSLNEREDAGLSLYADSILAPAEQRAVVLVRLRYHGGPAARALAHHVGGAEHLLRRIEAPPERHVLRRVGLQLAADAHGLLPGRAVHRLLARLARRRDCTIIECKRWQLLRRCLRLRKQEKHCPMAT